MQKGFIFLLASLICFQDVFDKTNGLGLRVDRKPSMMGASVCESGMGFSIRMADLAAAVPNITAVPVTAASCGSRTYSQVVPEACQWKPKTFLKMTFERGVELLRRGVPKEDAFQIFKHSRAVLWNLQVCNPIHNTENVVHIPLALDALYGIIQAQLQAKYSDTLVQPLVPILPSAQKAIFDLEHAVENFPVSLKFPDQILPPASIVSDTLPSQASIRERLASQQRSSKDSSTNAIQMSRNDDMFQIAVRTTQSECNANAPANTWILRPYAYPSKFFAPEQNCCASACVWLLEAVSITPSSSLLDPCCDKCNKFNCDPFSATIIAALELKTRIEVPSLLDEYATVVTIQL